MPKYKIIDNLDYIYSVADVEKVKHAWNRYSKFKHQYHIEMWNWLAENPDKGIRDWPHWDDDNFRLNMFLNANPNWPRFYSYACQYMLDNFLSLIAKDHLAAYCRLLCPIIWENGKECWNKTDGCFTVYSRNYVAYNFIADTKNDPDIAENIYNSAITIANYPVRPEVEIEDIL